MVIIFVLSIYDIFYYGAAGPSWSWTKDLARNEINNTHSFLQKELFSYSIYEIINSKLICTYFDFN